MKEVVKAQGLDATKDVVVAMKEMAVDVDVVMKVEEMMEVEVMTISG